MTDKQFSETAGELATEVLDAAERLVNVEKGFLTDAEIEKIAAKGREAKERIGTAGEHKAANSPDYGGDKLAAARADAVLGALKS